MLKASIVFSLVHFGRLLFAFKNCALIKLVSAVSKLSLILEKKSVLLKSYSDFVFLGVNSVFLRFMDFNIFCLFDLLLSFLILILFAILELSE